MNPYWKATLEAAAWTFLQAFVVAFGAAWAGIAAYDWNALGSAAVSAALAGVAAALSIIKSVVVKKIGADDSPFISAGVGIIAE